MRSARALLLTSILFLLLVPNAAAQRIAAETHIVRPGETLGLIAQSYGVNLYELAEENGISNAHLIHSWQLLTIPLGASVVDHSLPAPGFHVVQPGETLDSIAAAYGLNLFELQVLNNNYHGWIYPGDRLALPAPGREGDAIAPSPETAPAAEALVHIVQAGESLGKIAEAYGVTLYNLQATNGLYSWLIHPGQELQIPEGGRPPTPDLEAAAPETNGADAAPAQDIESAPEPALKTSEYVHVVQFGDALAKIAQAYGVSLFDLQTLNELPTWMIYPGQKLLIPEGGVPPVVEGPPALDFATDKAKEEGDAAATPTIESAPAPALKTSEYLHVVQFGDALAKIAQAYGVSLYDLQTLNELPTWMIYPGQKLLIPEGGVPPVVEGPPDLDFATDEAEEEGDAAAAPTIESAPAPMPAASEYVHIVQSGDALGKIAQAFGVSLIDLQRLNDLPSWMIHPGQKLLIPEGGAPPVVDPAPAAPDTQDSSATSGPDTHVVQRGETLFRIAKQYGISLDALMRANGIEDATRIHAGNKLRVRRLDEVAPPAALNDAVSPASASVSQPAAPTGRAVPIVTTVPAPGIYPAGDLGHYTVRRGDFLTDLGVRFNIEWRVLAKINGISPPTYALHPQQTLRLPSFAEYLSYLPNNSRYKLFYTTNHHPGPRVGVGREIVIELGRQSIYAYENGVLKKRALMSSGKMVTPTVLGDYEIYRKYRSQTMSGPGYSLDNVEWPMYFHAGYAIHGTWWHTMFGTPMSHGCVNLTNADAKWFWEFAPLGTPVHVRA